MQFRDPSYVEGFDILRVEVPAPEEMRQKFYDFLLAQEGKPYDMTGILAFVLGRDWQEEDSWFCSELIAAALSACGWLPNKLVVASNKITPPDLLLLVSALAPVKVQASSS